MKKTQAGRAADVTGVVLCGGRGHRLGGADKPLLQVQGETLLDRILMRLTPQVSRVLISANRNLDAYAARGEVVVDQYRDVGPLGGVHAALCACRTEFLFVCPGDTPGLDAGLVAALRARIDGSAAIHTHDGAGSQVLHTLLAARLGPNLDAFLAAGGRSVHAWLRSLDARQVTLALPTQAFHNINTPAELRAWRDLDDTARDTPQQ